MHHGDGEHAAVTAVPMLCMEAAIITERANLLQTSGTRNQGTAHE